MMSCPFTWYQCFYYAAMTCTVLKKKEMPQKERKGIDTLLTFLLAVILVYPVVMFFSRVQGKLFGLTKPIVWTCVWRCGSMINIILSLFLSFWSKVIWHSSFSFTFFLWAKWFGEVPFPFFDSLQRR